MKARWSRWAVPATLMAAAFALSACAGNNLSATPNVEGFNQAASAGADIGTRSGITILGAQPNVKCPKQYLDCETVSKKKGLALMWCYGPSSAQCSETNQFTWSGIVCGAKGKTCKKPIKQLTAKWTGPFKCRKKDKCLSKGYYELDTIKPGPGLKVTTKYVYKQDIHICASGSCQDAYIGLNVGK